jgi:hypothetical protein
MGRASERYLEENPIEDQVFICPDCQEEVSDSQDNYTSEGQLAEFSAGFRMCPKCNWYGQPEETWEQLDEEDNAKAREWALKGKPKIYFSGKISKYDWRQELLNFDMGRWDYFGIWDNDNKYKYPEVENFTYTGPFFISCDHGCSHGESTHGAGDNACIENNPSKKEIFDHCLKQIKDSEYMFCWINKLDCYGTLLELGVAHTLNKKIFIAIDKSLENEEKDELWFIKKSGECRYFKNVKEAWNEFSEWGPFPTTKEEKEEFTKSLSELKDLEKEDYEELIKREPMSKVIRFFKRDQEIVKMLKKVYDGKCQVKGCGYTFEKPNGENYCETHHLCPLNRNGQDDLKNMVCVCPNHHKLLHFGTEEEKKKVEFVYKEEHFNLLNLLEDDKNGNKS